MQFGRGWQHLLAYSVQGVQPPAEAMSPASSPPSILFFV